ncbi:hypothetical protein TNCV_1912101 [Trichonephila clavipes]|nr:hypothetical protein TNCV_1912101 [Trichonephila clavipes]
MNQGATNSGFQTTVQRSLLRMVLRSRRLVHAPMLTAVHQQRRLEFSHRYRNWASNERRQKDLTFEDVSQKAFHFGCLALIVKYGGLSMAKQVKHEGGQEENVSWYPMGLIVVLKHQPTT